MSTRPAGDIWIGPRAVAAVVTRALGTIEGYAGLAPGPKALIVHETPAGLEVEIEAFITYGAPIEPTARMLSARIRAALEQSTGLSVAAVRVYVQGLRHLG